MLAFSSTKKNDTILCLIWMKIYPHSFANFWVYLPEKFLSGYWETHKEGHVV